MAEESVEERDSSRSCGRMSSDSSSSSNAFLSSSTTSEDQTSESDGDMPVGMVASEGIYGWICSLLGEGKVARFLDKLRGIYELDWQDVVWKYWFEWRATRKEIKKSTSFNHRSASNTLRSALLNAYKDRGAQEFPEKKVLDRENKTIKRCFRLPLPVIEKLSKQTECKGQVVGTKARSNLNVSDLHRNASDGSTVNVKTEKPDPVYLFPRSSLDLSHLAMDLEESESLIDYMVFNNCDKTLTFLPQSSRALNHYSATSSGYESTGDCLPNIIQEMDPCEGPYQGGNKSYIFLKESFHSRSPGPGKKCKVLFGSCRHGSDIYTEVDGLVKNPYTIQVLIPHCTKLSGEQLARGRLTVEVTAKTLEGCYVGETEYTYIENLLEQFEICVRALDDEHMETEFTATSDETVLLHYDSPDTSGSHVFNHATLRVLVAVAVEQEAHNLLDSFFRCTEAKSICRQLNQQLFALMNATSSEKQRSLGDLPHQLLKRLSMECVDVVKEHPSGSSGDVESSEDSGKVKKIDDGYEGGPETSLEQEVTSYPGLVKCKDDSTYMKGEEKRFNHSSQQNEHNCKTSGTRHFSKYDQHMHPCDVFLGRSNGTADHKKSKESKAGEVENGDRLDKMRIFVVRKPCSPVPVSRSKSGFPDPRTDVFVELQIRGDARSFKDGDNKLEDCASEQVTNRKKDENQVTVNVKHFGTEQSAKDWEFKHVKRASGRRGYWFRFYKPNCELLLVFSLCIRQHAMHSEMKHKREEFEVLNNATVFLETVSWRGTFSKGAKTDTDDCSLELSLPLEVQKVDMPRSQTKLCKIMNLLHEFSDNGEFASFFAASEKLLRSFSDVDVKVAFLLEKAIVFLVQQDLKQAEITALQALEMASKADNHHLLAGRAYYYLANIYRRERKLGKAMRYIGLSKERLFHMGVCLDQSFMAYEEGNVMLDFISFGAVLKQKLVLLAKQCFERSLALRRQVDESHSQETLPSTHSFPFIKMAMLLLDCGTTSGRERPTCSCHIAEAKKFLDALESHGLDGMTKRRRLQFLLASSDLQYRLSNYRTAGHLAHESMVRAEEWGFNLEVLPARERLNHVFQLLAR